MGSSASNFPDNESLVDSLLESSDFPPNVERVLRLVDRGHYAIEPKSQIYSDSAWRVENLHLSAPGIYATVLHELNIQPGQSVLNIGSGTGYLSTMLGLLLGSNGVNHGIELHASNVAFARERLEDFMSKSDAVYERDFCPPQFVAGNIFSVVRPAPSQDVNPGSAGSVEVDEYSLDDSNQLTLPTPFVHIDPPPRIRNGDTETWPTYDRIYVGSMVSSLNQLTAILRLLNVGGILIAPIYDQLHKIERTTENTLNDTVLSNVSFVSLVLPTEDEPDVFPPPKRQVKSLERLACRCFQNELRRLILERKGALPTLGRFERQPRRCQSPPHSPTPSTATVSVPSTANARDTVVVFTTSTTNTSPKASTPTPPSAHSSHCPSTSGSSSPLATTQRLSPASEIDIGVGVEDELNGVTAAAPPRPPPTTPPSPPLPPAQRRSISVTITPGSSVSGGDTTVVDGDSTAAEQMDFIDMISRNFLYCRMLARSRQRNASTIEEASDEEEGSFTSTTSSSSTNNSGNPGDDHVEAEHEIVFSIVNEDEETCDEIESDGEASTSPQALDRQPTRQQRRRNKRRRRENGTEVGENAGVDGEKTGADHRGANDGDQSGSRHRCRRRTRSSSSRRNMVWKPQSYTFREEMYLLLGEVKHELCLSDYPCELVLKII